jgi:hypothetical protein
VRQPIRALPIGKLSSVRKVPERPLRSLAMKHGQRFVRPLSALLVRFQPYLASKLDPAALQL